MACASVFCLCLCMHLHLVLKLDLCGTVHWRLHCSLSIKMMDNLVLVTINNWNSYLLSQKMLRISYNNNIRFMSITYLNVCQSQHGFSFRWHDLEWLCILVLALFTGPESHGCVSFSPNRQFLIASGDGNSIGKNR